MKQIVLPNRMQWNFWKISIIISKMVRFIKLYFRYFRISFKAILEIRKPKIMLRYLIFMFLHG